MLHICLIADSSTRQSSVSTRTILSGFLALPVVRRAVLVWWTSQYILMGCPSGYSEHPMRSGCCSHIPVRNTELRMLRLLAQGHQDLPLGCDMDKIRNQVQFQGSELLLWGCPMGKLYENLCFGSKGLTSTLASSQTGHSRSRPELSHSCLFGPFCSRWKLFLPKAYCAETTSNIPSQLCLHFGCDATIYFVLGLFIISPSCQ